jgi:hypothetical protein
VEPLRTEYHAEQLRLLSMLSNQRAVGIRVRIGTGLYTKRDTLTPQVQEQCEVLLPLSVIAIRMASPTPLVIRKAQFEFFEQVRMHLFVLVTVPG